MRNDIQAKRLMPGIGYYPLSDSIEETPIRLVIECLTGVLWYPPSECAS